MRFFFLLIFFFSFKAQAFLTSCITYDVTESHPDDVRVSLFIKCMRKGDTLWVDGGIDPYLIDELRTYNTEPIKNIYLNSGGGRVEDAFELARFIRENGITTIVRKNALCASACTLLFQAGVKRMAHKRARFMYHSARRLLVSLKDQQEIQKCLAHPSPDCLAPIEEAEQDLLQTTNEMFDLYEELGASTELREDYFNMPEQKDWWVSGNYVGIQDWWLMAPTLVHYDVVTEVVAD